MIKRNASDLTDEGIILNDYDDILKNTPRLHIDKPNFFIHFVPIGNNGDSNLQKIYPISQSWENNIEEEGIFEFVMSTPYNDQFLFISNNGEVNVSSQGDNPILIGTLGETVSMIMSSKPNHQLMMDMNAPSGKKRAMGSKKSNKKKSNKSNKKKSNKKKKLFKST